MKIAITGKGGTGKTAFAALFMRAAIPGLKPNEVILAVDADADANLAAALGVEVEKTIGDMREKMMRERDSIPLDTSKEAAFESWVFETLYEGDGFDLLVMGRPEGTGCYCYANNMLTAIMERIVDNYPITVIDMAAGMEHISRQTISEVDILLVVTDNSRRGLGTAERIRDIAKEIGMKYDRMYVVANKVTDETRDRVVKNASELGLEVIGTVPYDPQLAEIDLEGKPLIELPANSTAVKAVAEIVEALL
jgi:CO dehydrogenase maturation factor